MFLKLIDGWHKIYNYFGIKVKEKVIPEHYDVLNLVFDKKEGIGNRIFGLVNYVYYTMPNVVNIYWDNRGWVNKKFSEIFDYKPDYELNEYHHISIIKRWEKRWKHLNNEITVNFPPVHLKTLEGIVLDFSVITPKLYKKYSKEFKKLKPSKEVLERIHQVNLPESFVALQVRNSADWNLYGRNESLELFFNEMGKFPQDTKFYLSAMNEKTSDAFKNKYGDRIIELPDKNYKSMIDAMADLYIMSYAKDAIYSYGSTFGELAFWLSEDFQNVKVVGDENGWKIQKGIDIKK